LRPAYGIDYHSQYQEGMKLVIACVCRAISHRKILTVIENGASTVEEVVARCGAGSDCGACEPLINSLLNAQDRPTELSSAKGCRQPTSPVDAAA
jgi:bacterioferritin-associated ferredoxin